MEGQVVNLIGIWITAIVFAVTVLGFLWNIQLSVNNLHGELAGLRERTARIEVKLDSFAAQPKANTPQSQ